MENKNVKSHIIIFKSSVITLQLIKTPNNKFVRQQLSNV